MPAPITGTTKGYCIRLLNKAGNYIADLTNKVQVPISFRLANPGGCGDCSFTIYKPFEDTSGIDYDYGIEIWVNGSCWYAGFVQDFTPKLGDLDTWTVQCGGYANMYQRVNINKKYGSADTPTILDVGKIVRDLMDTKIVPITGLTYDLADIPDAGFEIDQLDFTRVPAMDALNTLAGVAQTAYWGVGPDKQAFFKPRSTDVKFAWHTGKDITYNEETRSTTELHNRLILRGGTLADGSTFVKIIDRPTSQELYGVREGVEDVSSITTDGVADAYGQWWLDINAYPAIRGKLSLAFVPGREQYIEPDGLYEVTIGNQTYTRSIGAVNYTIEDNIYKVDIETGYPRPKMGDIIKRILYQVQTGAQRQEQTSAAVSASTLSDGKVVIYLQPSSPTAGTIGDYWIDTDDSNVAYQYNGITYSLATARQSVDTVITVSGTDGIADGLITVFFTNAQPGSMAVGDIWVDTTSTNVYRWNGSDKVRVTDEAQVTAIRAVASLVDTIPPPQPTINTASASIAIVDGSPEYRLTVNWTPIVNPGDFRRYIVYYRRVGDTGWVEAASIVDITVGTYLIRGLSEATSYEFDVLSEDIYNNKSLFHLSHVPYQTSADLPPANVNNVIGTFVTADAQISWDAVTTNSDTSPAVDIRRYRVVVKNGSTVLRTETTYVNAYTYDINKNRADNAGTPIPSLNFTVEAEDYKGQFSATPTAKSLVNPVPSAPEFPPTADPFISKVFIGMAISSEGDIARYKIQHCTDGATWADLVINDSAVYTHNAGANTSNYYRYAYIDVFGRVSSYSPSVGPVVASVQAITEADLASNFGMVKATLYYDGVAQSVDTSVLFDGLDTTSLTLTADAFIQYDFTIGQIFTAAKFLASTQVQYYVQTSEDGEVWTDRKGSDTAKATSVLSNVMTSASFTSRVSAKHLRVWFPSGAVIKELKAVTWMGADELEAGIINLAKSISLYNDATGSGFQITSNKATFYNSAIEIYTDAGPSAGTQAMWTSQGVVIKQGGSVICVLGRFGLDANGGYVAPNGTATDKWGLYVGEGNTFTKLTSTDIKGNLGFTGALRWYDSNTDPATRQDPIILYSNANGVEGGLIQNNVKYWQYCTNSFIMQRADNAYVQTDAYGKIPVQGSQSARDYEFTVSNDGSSRLGFWGTWTASSPTVHYGVDYYWGEGQKYNDGTYDASGYEDYIQLEWVQNGNTSPKIRGNINQLSWGTVPQVSVQVVLETLGSGVWSAVSGLAKSNNVRRLINSSGNLVDLNISSVLSDGQRYRIRLYRRCEDSPAFHNYPNDDFEWTFTGLWVSEKLSAGATVVILPGTWLSTNGKLYQTQSETVTIAGTDAPTAGTKVWRVSLRKQSGSRYVAIVEYVGTSIAGSSGEDFWNPSNGSFRNDSVEMCRIIWTYGQSPYPDYSYNMFNPFMKWQVTL